MCCQWHYWRFNIVVNFRDGPHFLCAIKAMCLNHYLNKKERECCKKKKLHNLHKGSPMMSYQLSPGLLWPSWTPACDPPALVALFHCCSQMLVISWDEVVKHPFYPRFRVFLEVVGHSRYFLSARLSSAWSWTCLFVSFTHFHLLCSSLIAPFWLDELQVINHTLTM